jgi:hypothetical protein
MKMDAPASNAGKKIQPNNVQILAENSPLVALAVDVTDSGSTNTPEPRGTH